MSGSEPVVGSSRNHCRIISCKGLARVVHRNILYGEMILDTLPQGFITGDTSGYVN